MTRGGLALLVAVAVVGCEAVLGFEDHHLAPPVDASAGSAGAAGSASGGSGGAGDAGADVIDAAPETGGDAEAGTRVTDGLSVLYDFEEGSGNKVNDVSGVGSAVNLTIKDPFLTNWIPGGLTINGSTIIKSSGPPNKLLNACKASKQITIEAWIRPANLTQLGPARIVTLSIDTSARNFTLGQETTQFNARLRTPVTGQQGEPPVLTLPGTVTTELTHVVYTRASDGKVTIYLDTVISGSGDVNGDFSNWDTTYELALANEHTLNRVWFGDYFTVAIYCRALSPAEVAQNFAVGPI